MKTTYEMLELKYLLKTDHTLVNKLYKVGVHSAEMLKLLGSRKAFLLVKMDADPTAGLDMLYKLENTIQGIEGRKLSFEKKLELEQLYSMLVQSEKSAGFQFEKDPRAFELQPVE